ncbi:MAG: TadE family protein [Thermoguttaceae bacterium]
MLPETLQQAQGAAAALPPRRSRRGVAAVEAAIIVPMVVLLLMGLWEVGRFMDVSMTVQDAARRGARMAAGGVSGGANVTCATVQTTVQNYLQAAGFPSAAYNAAQVTVTNLSSHTWTDPWQAQPLDPFSVTVTIPSGTPFNSLLWVPSNMTGVSQITAQVEWLSNNDTTVTVSTQLPY